MLEGRAVLIGESLLQLAHELPTENFWVAMANPGAANKSEVKFST